MDTVLEVEELEKNQRDDRNDCVLGKDTQERILS